MIQKSMTNRKTESLTGSISKNPENPSPTGVQIFSSPSDIGVRRNLGRCGSRYAPMALYKALVKLNNHIGDQKIEIFPVTDQEKERENFEETQLLSSKKIKGLIQNNPTSPKFHIGGGHDHIFPLLKAIEDQKDIEKILIINIDAHCDTRVDEIHHSGTPFRNFDSTNKKPTKLIQYGIHIFSNSLSTLSKLENLDQEKYFLNDIAKRTQNFSLADEKLLEVIYEYATPKTAIVLSLDCDGLPGYEFPAVSAPNPHGIPLHHVKEILRELKNLSTKIGAPLYFGMYEYNPVFDETSALGAKILASLIFETLAP